MKVGIIGCGNIGLGGHARSFRALPGVEVAAVADPTPERRALARETLGLDEKDCYADYRDLLERADLDAVAVTTPQSARPAIVVAACAAGKHVLSEKPMALTPAEADAMIDAARQNNVRLAIVHNYLFRPDIVALKDLIDRGEIGEVEYVAVNMLSVEDRPASPQYRPTWRHDVTAAGGGVLMDMLHGVYLAAHLMGSPIRAVSAAIDRREPAGVATGNVEDAAYCRFEHANGFSQVNIAWGQGPGGIEIMGTRGRIFQFNERFGTTPFTPPDRIHLVNDRGEFTIPLSKERRPDVAGAIHADFVASILEERPPRAPGEEGKATLEAVLGAYTSAALGQELRLPFSTDHPVYRRGAQGVWDLPPAPDSRVATRRIFRVEGN